MPRPKTLPAFSSQETIKIHALLATKITFMMGRKMEEGDWADVYCRAKNIPDAGWSNLNLDIMHDNLGIEHKMLCRKSNVDMLTFAGQTLMHPSATRSIRVPPLTTEPNEAMRDLLTQYGALIEARREKVRAQTSNGLEADMRTGWLLWQDSLRQFLYFEEEMLVPNPANYFAKWVTTQGGGARKRSTSLWIYERDTELKRFSVTTEAGAKIQPYFDIPSLSDPNLYLFTVQGEELDTDWVRVWISETTSRELEQQIGSLESVALSHSIVENVAKIERSEDVEVAKTEVARPIRITAQAYDALREALPGVSDEHCFQQLVQFLRHPI